MFNETKLNGGKEPMIELEAALPKILFSKSCFIIVPRQFTVYMEKVDSSTRLMCEVISSVPVDAQADMTGSYVKKGSPLKEIFNYK